MGAEQRRAALRVMTPCEFSVIFVDLHERPYLGETHFRLDISGDLRWFEMEKIWGTSVQQPCSPMVHSNVVNIRVGGGRIRRLGRRRGTYDQLQSRATERRGTPHPFGGHAEDVRDGPAARRV